MASRAHHHASVTRRHSQRSGSARAAGGKARQLQPYPASERRGCPNRRGGWFFVARRFQDQAPGSAPRVTGDYSPFGDDDAVPRTLDLAGLPARRGASSAGPGSNGSCKNWPPGSPAYMVPSTARSTVRRIPIITPHWYLARGLLQAAPALVAS